MAAGGSRRYYPPFSVQSRIYVSGRRCHRRCFRVGTSLPLGLFPRGPEFAYAVWVLRIPLCAGGIRPPRGIEEPGRTGPVSVVALFFLRDWCSRGVPFSPARLVCVRCSAGCLLFPARCSAKWRGFVASGSPRIFEYARGSRFCTWHSWLPTCLSSVGPCAPALNDREEFDRRIRISICFSFLYILSP